MKSSALFAIGILLLWADVAIAAVVVVPATGDADPALLAELQRSMATVAGEAPAESDGELRLEARAAADGIALEVALAPADGSPAIRERRVASPASAAAQARAMARAVLRKRAEAQRAAAGPAPSEPAEIALAAPAPTPIDEARTAARPGIALGIGLDLAGFVGLVASFAVLQASEGHDDGLRVAACASAGAIALGSLVSTASYSIRHAAYRRAGAHLRPYKATVSWVFTTATLALYGLAVAATVEHARSEPGTDAQLGDAIGWAIESGFIGAVFVAAFEFELFNATLVRALWHRDLRRAEKAPRPAVAVAPFVAPGGGGRARPLAGLSAVIAF